MLVKVKKYSASWCAPCKSYAPIFDKVSEEYNDKLTFEKIDVDEASEEESNLMNDLGIRSIPTTVLFDENDNVLKKLIGSVSEKDLKNIIDIELGEA